MIVEYVTAWGEVHHHLDDEVSEFISEGWELYGNPYASVNEDGGTIYNQAMVRRAKVGKDADNS